MCAACVQQLTVMGIKNCYSHPSYPRPLRLLGLTCNARACAYVCVCKCTQQTVLLTLYHVSVPAHDRLLGWFVIGAELIDLLKRRSSAM